jgi:hypothetical protein
MNFSHKIKKIIIITVIFLVFWSGILILSPKKDIQEMFGAIQGSLQWELTPSTADLFNCGGRDDCEDDVEPIFDESQHKYIAQAYDLFGFPLAGVKYKWTQNDAEDIIKFRDFDALSVVSDESESAIGDIDQEIYVQPYEENLQNGEATVNVLGYIDDEVHGKNQSVDVTLYFCLNTWPTTATFPFSDSTSPQFSPYSNFETFYCKDRGDITNTDDDYVALKVTERADKTPSDSDYSFLCSGGGGDGMKCNKDYFISYSGGTWDKISLNGFVAANIFSPEALAMDGGGILFIENYEWAYYSGSVWSSGNLTSSSPAIIPVWPDGLTVGVELKPTALALNGGGWLLIEDNFYVKNDPASQLPEYAASPDQATLAEAGWPTDVQFPTDVAWWSNAGNNYLLAMKDNYYRIYSKDNSCNVDFKCETPGGRIWGSCISNNECYWGELFNLFELKDWPTSITQWQTNVRFPIKTIGLENNEVRITSSCEYSGGICLLKEFLLIANPACNDGVDNDDDGECDWQNNICGAGIPKDSDCTDPDDNSESGTCDDGIDNDNDGTIDYPNDFSCSSYSDVEEEGCAGGQQCCDNIDNDSDSLIDQQDGGCTDRTDNDEVNICGNGLDDDSDGLIDLADPGCTDATDDDEKGITQCDDGIDNDGDTFIDLADPECLEPGDENEAA